MKGVLICGGTGSRLRPLTEVTNKSLLPVYDKPLVLYPLQVLLDAGIHEIAIITGKEHMDQMTAFLGSGDRFGCAFSYKTQERPGGIAQALSLAEDVVGNDSLCAILGDNLFFDNLTPLISSFRSGGHVFLKEVPDARRFGVAEIEQHGTQARVLSIEEKPARPKTNLAVTGCYLYDRDCFNIIRSLKPSARGELEIADVSAAYAARKELTATILQKEWIDAGTFESLFHAAELIRNQRRIAS